MRISDWSSDVCSSDLNTPAVIHTRVVPGDRLDITVAAKGGGSENKTKFAMLNPSDSIVDWVLEMVPKMGAGWCPPGMLGIGIGGTAEQAMVMAQESLMEARESVGEGKSVSVRVDLGGPRNIKKTKPQQ